MKRGLRIATSFILLFTMVLFLGLNISVFADGAKNPPSDNSAASSAPAPQQNVTAHFPSPAIEKTSATDTNIKKNTTETKKTYNSNVWVYSGYTFTVGKNGNIVINGDLNIVGTFKISSGTLTVNGDIWVYGSLQVSGTAKIIVNKATKVISVNGTNQYGGSLVVTDEYDTGSIMTVRGSANITVNNAQNGGFFVQEGARILMDSATAKITSYSRCYFGGDSTSGSLSAGTLEIVNSAFHQSDEYSNYSFCPGPSFNVILRGTNATARYVGFDTPLDSYFSNLVVSGYSFDAYSEIPLRKNLSADYAVNCNNADILYQGNLNGKKLTLTGYYVYVSESTDTTLGGGTLTVNGSLYIDSNSRLVMNNSADKLVVNGALTAAGQPAIFTSGRIDINGDFTQMGGNFTPGPNMAVRILGTNRTFRFGDPDNSYFSKVELASGTTFEAASLVSVRCNLEGNVNWSGVPALYYGGNMGGHSLTAGNLVIPDGASLTVGGGTLTVAGNLSAQGDLIMTNAGDVITVSGLFSAAGDSTGEFTNGRLYLKGGLEIYDTPKCFAASGSHKTIFCGAGSQPITGLVSGSKFAKLYIANDSLDVATLPTSEYYDSLTVTGTTLQSLGASAGAISPTFSGATNSYKLLLPTDTTGVTLTPALLDRYGTPTSTSWLTFGDSTTPATEITVADVPLNGSKTVTIVAHAADNVLTRTTTVKIMRINPNLKAGAAGLGTLPAGAVATGADTTYTVDMPATMASVAFAPVLDSPDSTLKIDGGAATKSVIVGVGASVPCHVVVTAQDGTTKKTYDVTFTRHKPLASLTSSTGGMTFNPATASYNIVTAASSATVTAVASADCNGAVTMNGVATLSKTIPLTPGTPAKVTVTAKDATGKTTTTYTVNFNSVRLLSGIKLSKGKLTPAFSPSTLVYNVNLPNSTTSVTITPTKTSDCKSMTINGKKVSSVKLSPKAGSKATATIVCAYTGGVTQTYTVNVYRIQPVSKISLSTGKLSPGFSPTKYSYKVSLPASASSVIVSVAKTPSCKELTINGAIATSVKLYPAAGGSATAKVVATAQNGAKYTYTITVKRAAMLKLIKLSSGTLLPAFNPLVTTYNVTVPSTTAQVTVTPTKMNGVKSMLINGKPVKSIVLKPAVGDKATAIITLTAGGAKTTYTVIVTRVALVTGINVSAGALSPAFNAATKAYVLDLPAGVSAVTITPVKSSTVKSLKIDGAALASKTVTPALGGSQDVVITATDNMTTATYTVKVSRAAPLTALAVTGGTSAANYPVAYAANTGSYDIYIPYAEESVTVSGSPSAGYACTVNDLASPQTIPVAAGATVTAVVVARPASGSGVATTYTLTIHRLPQTVTAITVKVGEGADLLTPAFAYATHDYTAAATVGSAATVTVTAAAGCTVTIDSVAGNTHPIAKPDSESHKVVVVSVSPGHGFAPIVYNVDITWS